MVYRRLKGKYTWHWCSNCNNWPKADYDTSAAKPTRGELCNECRAKQSAGTCKALVRENEEHATIG